MRTIRTGTTRVLKITMNGNNTAGIKVIQFTDFLHRLMC